MPVPNKTRRFNEANWKRSLAWTSSVFGGSRDTVLEEESTHKNVSKVYEAVHIIMKSTGSTKPWAQFTLQTGT